jgi:MoxR-like ATPase
LLTGKPGTGKSELAERIAWEFNLGHVLRFEAQSLSEANDLFYRFDLVGQMAAAQLVTASRIQAQFGTDGGKSQPGLEADTKPERFISFGPLGKAILRSAPTIYHDLFPIAFPNTLTESLPQASPSVVLIDEIDKASRDFPNDLLNGIDRLEFRIRELKDRPVKAPFDQEHLRPIVIITSNSERDLPGPFLRRCIYFHIPDPDKARLRNIVRARVFPESLNGDADRHGPNAELLPPVYEDLLTFFMEYRDSEDSAHAYEPGTTELLDWSQALRRSQVDESKGIKDNYAAVRRTASAVAKQRHDRERLLSALQQLSPIAT